MADGVNRIVPPSVSLDRATGLGRDKEKREREEKSKAHSPPAAPQQESRAQDDLLEPERDRTKGQNIDISA